MSGTRAKRSQDVAFRRRQFFGEESSVEHVHRAAIIGFGPRGLGVLERIIANGRSDRNFRLEVHIFDRHLPGTGAHDVNQAEHFLLNTVSSQLTTFTDHTVRDAGPPLLGPTFNSWKHGIRQTERLATETADGNTYHCRAEFGRYMNWAFDYLLQLAPPNVRVIHHRTIVNRLVAIENSRWMLGDDTGSEHEVDYCFLTTGHSRRVFSKDEEELVRQVELASSANQHVRVVLDPYPIGLKLSSIGAGQTVAIAGAGLTSYDAIAELTVGRGGEFVREGKRRVYRSSGGEPRLLLFSRTGLTLMARGVNEKGPDRQYKGQFLTPELISELRRQSPDGKLDFERDVLPPLSRDMQCAYYFALIKAQRGEVDAMKFHNDFVSAQDDAARQVLVSEQVRSKDRFCWNRLTNPIPESALVNRTEFSKWSRSYLEEDVRQAELGNISGPVKAACDVLRDLRDTLRLVVDFAGLNERSHMWFSRSFVPLMNRLAVGPPKERIEELIALLDAGIVQFDFGPGATCRFSVEEGKFILQSQCFPELSATADVLIHARIAMPNPKEDKSPLMTNLLQNGLVRPFRNGGMEVGGIEVDRNLNVVDREGRSQPTFFSLGTPTEGCKFYTFVLPRPGVNSTALVDAGRAVLQMRDHIRQANLEVDLPVPLDSFIPSCV